eukprot:CAMPEP_0201712026 /NCGR_PEP_ID=MMETSP0578-20130828/59433_1 /ASSEMBLY_ACC=CAM_ASM_000663 /TAXON_ID=267565 /ORGANISM="Skeletonema grethea, Strain CCMP 1804" /LENGTH=810 /DNA_ID=CAMNT_0048201083 /DNA_START=53 /DNA_END=2485 /DNA_ORIENTATION=-
MKLHLNKLLVLLSASLFADARFANVTVCESTSPYSYDSGDTSAATTVISIDKAPWIQLDLSGTKLAAGSTLTIAGKTASQVITSDDLSMNDFSAVFDGSSVSVELSSAETEGLRGKSAKISSPSPTSRVVVSSVNAGLCKYGDGEIIGESICGDTDDRTPSNDVRVGRIGGCTGWLISEDVFIQAGHCGTPSTSDRIHFVYGTGSADPEDQYAVDVSTYQGVDGGVGNDWGAGRLLPNSITGKLPGTAQSDKCGTPGCGWYNLGSVPSGTSGNNIRITGYGTAAVASRSQKTHVGALASIGSTSLSYIPDTTGGNSGSPVIHEETGNAIGVHTHGGCSATGGSNKGTRIDRQEFADHVDFLLEDCVTDSDCDDGVFCNGVETCVAGKCRRDAETCDDGLACTIDTCNVASDVCEHQAKCSGLCTEPTGVCECGGSQKRIEVDILTDNYPAETTWTVTDSCGSAGVILSGGPYSSTSTSTLFSDDVCATVGRYDFTINDSFGDGICCGWGSGAYTVKYDGVVEASGGQFGSTETKTFGSACPSDPTPPPTTPPPTEPPTAQPTPVPTTAAPTPVPTSTETKTFGSACPSDPTPPPTTPPPTEPPTAQPTPVPTTAAPTPVPTSSPTASPSTPPSPAPTSATSSPTKNPTSSPTTSPTSSPVVPSKTLFCGRGDVDGKPCAEGRTETAPVDELHEVRCCRDCTGISCSRPWKRKCSTFDPNLYARSKVGGVCKVGTFAEAQEFCENAGGTGTRLCTPREIENNCAKGTGCNFDRELVWACGNDGYQCTTDAECCGSCVNGTCGSGSESSLFY